MKVLVANLGSTSFKYRLFDLPAETQLARGGIDRIGQGNSACFVEIGGRREESTQAIAEYVGVWIQIKYPYQFRMLGSTITIAKDTVMRI